MARQETAFRLKLGQRVAEVKAYDSVGVEDSMNILMKAAMHRIMTHEDWTEPVPREVKDFIIKSGLYI